MGAETSAAVGAHVCCSSRGTRSGRSALDEHGSPVSCESGEDSECSDSELEEKPQATRSGVSQKVPPPDITGARSPRAGSKAEPCPASPRSPSVVDSGRGTASAGRSSLETAGSTSTGKPGEMSLDVAKERMQVIRRSEVAIRGPGRKQPVSNKFFGGAKDRYLAALPGVEDKTRGKDAIEMFKRWRRGSLGYWENYETFSKKDEPKGSVNLLHIAQILRDGPDSAGVSVIYKDPKTGKTDRLEVTFENPARADEWKEALRCLRSALKM